MKILGTKGLKVLKTFHLLFAFLWIGGGLSMTLLMLTTEPSESDAYMRALVLKQIDDWLVIVGANGCLLTGIVYGAFTRWGWFRHGWITAKWILVAFMMLSGTFMMGPPVNGNAVLGISMSEYAQNVETTLFWAVPQCLLYVVVIILSVWKPKFKKQNQ